MRVPLKRRAELAQRNHIFDRAKSSHPQRNIQCRRLVPRRPENAIAIRPRRILRIVLGRAQIERRRQVHDGQRAAGVARARRAERHKIVAAHQPRRVAQLLNRIFLRHRPGCCISQRHCLLLRVAHLSRVPHLRCVFVFAPQMGRRTLQSRLRPRIDPLERFHQVLHGVGHAEPQIAFAVMPKRRA